MRWQGSLSRVLKWVVSGLWPAAGHDPWAHPLSPSLRSFFPQKVFFLWFPFCLSLSIIFPSSCSPQLTVFNFLFSPLPCFVFCSKSLVPSSFSLHFSFSLSVSPFNSQLLLSLLDSIFFFPAAALQGPLMGISFSYPSGFSPKANTDLQPKFFFPFSDQFSEEAHFLPVPLHGDSEQLISLPFHLPL